MRKLVEFDEESWNALVLLGKDRMATLQDLADEAFTDLLKKHNRPLDLRKALRDSVKANPQPDTRAGAGKRTKVAPGYKQKARVKAHKTKPAMRAKKE